MPLITCKKCGNEVATEYSYCTQCKAPLPQDVSRLREFDSRTSGLSTFWGVVILGWIIAEFIEDLWLIPKGLVTHENRELVYWILVLPIQLTLFTGNSLITGKELKVGKIEYPLSRWARFTVFGVLFAFLGYLLGGQLGVIIGVFMAASLSIAIARFLKHRRNNSELRITAAVP